MSLDMEIRLIETIPVLETVPLGEDLEAAVAIEGLVPPLAVGVYAWEGGVALVAVVVCYDDFFDIEVVVVAF